jgi:hypothetical protein
MDPKLAAILKKAKVLDQAAKKYDTNPDTTSTSSPGLYEQISTPSSGGAGLYDQMGVGGGTTSTPAADRMDVNSEMYSESVENSKLPPAIKAAMKSNPIPQPDMVGGFDSDMVNEIRNAGTPQPQIEPELGYSDDDEKDMDFQHPIPQQRRPQQRPQQVMNEGVTNVGNIRQMIAEEIAKALPVVIEDYFDKRVLKENVQFKAGNTTFSGTVSPLPKKRTKKRG